MQYLNITMDAILLVNVVQGPQHVTHNRCDRSLIQTLVLEGVGNLLLHCNVQAPAAKLLRIE